MFCKKFWKKSLNPYAPWLSGPSSSCSVWESCSVIKEKSQILRNTYFMSSIAPGTFIYLFHLKTSVFYILIYWNNNANEVFITVPILQMRKLCQELTCSRSPARKGQIWSPAPTTPKSTLPLEYCPRVQVSSLPFLPLRSRCQSLQGP